MPKETGDISDEAKNATIDRKDFDAALKKLIAAAPMPKTAVSRKIRTGRAEFRRRIAKRPDQP